jgi:hypothetical protein
MGRIGCVLKVNILVSSEIWIDGRSSGGSRLVPGAWTSSRKRVAMQKRRPSVVLECINLSAVVGVAIGGTVAIAVTVADTLAVDLTVAVALTVVVTLTLAFTIISIAINIEEAFSWNVGCRSWMEYAMILVDRKWLWRL